MLVEYSSFPWCKVGVEKMEQKARCVTQGGDYANKVMYERRHPFFFIKKIYMYYASTDASLTENITCLLFIKQLFGVSSLVDAK